MRPSDADLLTTEMIKIPGGIPSFNEDMALCVVRCRDCIEFEEIGKYPMGMPEYPGGESFGYCYHWQYEQGMSPNEVDGNGFCCYGERRKSNENHT